MDILSDNTIPWQLIASALQDNLSAEEATAFQQWLAAGVENRELFMKLKDIWQHDLDDYPVYQQASETIGWDALRNKLQQVAGEKEQLVTFVNAGKKRVRLISIVSIAAIFVIAIGVVTWLMWFNTGSRYNTGNTEQRTVSLADGTIIQLFPSTSIEVPANYNRSVRKVIIKNGQAFFEVQHKKDIPFIVDLGTASIKDIGTGFHVKKTGDSILVSVVTGQVEFTEHINNRVELLSAGMHLKLFSTPGNDRPTLVVDGAGAHNTNRLHFTSTPLSEVIRTFKEVYGKQIIIIDSTTAQKKFTGHLQGLSFEGAMDVLCTSLNLYFTTEKDVYYLKKQ